MNKKVVHILKSGGVGILQTDTIYGIVGSAFSKIAVERIYKLRKRNPKKPFIILIGSLDDIAFFGIALDRKMKNKLEKIWPGPISVILKCSYKKFAYLHRGMKRLAFRLPKKRNLRTLLKKTGPLVAPSANWEGYPPAVTVREARKYFSDEVDFYIDEGPRESLPSTLLEIKNGKIVILREGLGMQKIL
jgi:L-threonylcarbamoyladenylate synthase